MFNTLVHVIMYAYYLLAIFRIPFRWKRWITTLQVIQFATSFALLAATVLVYYLGGSSRLGGIWNPSPEQVSDIVSRAAAEGFEASEEICAGSNGLAFNVLFNAVLLYLFVGVLGKSKKPKAA